MANEEQTEDKRLLIEMLVTIEKQLYIIIVFEGAAVIGSQRNSQGIQTNANRALAAS